MNPAIYKSGGYETTAMTSSELSNYRNNMRSASHAITSALRTLNSANDSDMYNDSIFLLKTIKRDIADTLSKTLSEHRFATT